MRRVSQSFYKNIFIIMAAAGLFACSLLVRGVFGIAMAVSSFVSPAMAAKNRHPLRRATASIPAAAT